jgi:ATP-dependent helicase HrpA/adenine-specific DNA-methyltransferase
MREKRTSPSGYQIAHSLRKNLTPAEGMLWSRLKRNQLNGISFRRQHAIGPFVVDFCAPREMLIIELDGSQHIDQSESDVKRTEYLVSKGYRIIRFWNNDVMNDLNGVYRSIEQELHK